MEKTTKAFDVTAESGIIAIWQREKFKLDRVFSEFVDNSLQSYLDHKDTLDRLPDGKKCVVQIIWNADKIVITDNAFGMNEEEFARALKPKATNPNALRNNQLSVYGLGLKYASVYLGNHYSISSTRYGSTIHYYAEVDVPEFEKNNPKNVDAIVSDTFPEKHETILEITSIRIKRTPDKERDLREKLGIIYNHYINSGDLSISINGIPVSYVRPQLRPKEEGGVYFEKFEDSFTIGDKKYEFSGWMGLLNRGNQAITGINLMQAKRCIELGYKPKKFFGTGNSFENSRVVGEIVFNGENYVLSFNKDGFVWTDDGAEDAFIEKLINIPQVKYIKRMAHELTYTDDDDKTKKKTQNIFKNNSSIVLTPPTVTKEKKEKKVEKPSDTKIEPEEPKQTTIEVDKKEQIEVETKKDGYDRYSVMVNGKNTPLCVDIQQGNGAEDWIKLEKYEDGYLLKINTGNNFIGENFNTQTSKAASNAIAIVLATSMLKAQNSGLKLSEAMLLLNSMNEIMGKPKDGDQ
ncbi:MAG: ATP-binding protein [Candidatus Enteromonas sp.]|nr:ATP-binding protein [Candidatus Enteromonas sp.]